MSINLAVVMDPVQSINPSKDSTVAMMREAQSRDWSVSYLQITDLCLFQNKPYAYARRLIVNEDTLDWYILGDEKFLPLEQFDVILMRKDPPFCLEYIYATYFLEMAQSSGVLVINDPASLRGFNEKFSCALFPECCPASIVTTSSENIYQFLEAHETITLKPLDGMGGENIFKVSNNDPNLNTIIKLLTEDQKRPIMVQRFIPEISEGDKRILLINGTPIPYALSRKPKPGDWRGNLAKGALPEGVPLTEREYWICERVAPTLKAKGLYFVGLDVIGDYLTEINVTSPTCIQELDNLYNLNISATFLDCVQTLHDSTN